MTDHPRLIEFAFPLKQASLDSVHEKNVRHGHISTLHIWPARRPLAACRAALLATLLPDPGTAEARKALCEKIGGRVVRKMEKKKMPGGATIEREKEQTEGGILHWLGEEPTSGGKKKRDQWRAQKKRYEQDLAWFREEIRKAYGGRVPKVLDPFAGGGAIPLEAMRLGCEATAIDINPVAWFILKCTLEYPQKLAGQKRPLPAFVLKDRAFMEAFFKAQGLTKAETRARLKELGLSAEGGQSSFTIPEQFDADLSWHVRAWGQWVLAQARRELAPFYPVYADFEPLKPGAKSYEREPMRLVPLRDDGNPDMAALNGDFSAEYLADPRNPRWVAKPTVAYLWARTVTCKNCRATIPLLKTRWLCKKDKKRVLLTMEPSRDKTGVVFGIEADVPIKGSNTAQRREHDKRLGAGTMSRAGAKCPCCEMYSTSEDIRLEARAGRMGNIAIAVVTEASGGKAYRVATPYESELAAEAHSSLDSLFANLPHGLPTESIPQGASRAGGGSPFTVHIYGLTEWRHLFTPRQLLSLGVLLKYVRAIRSSMKTESYSEKWIEAISAYATCGINRLADYNSTICVWGGSRETIAHTFTRFALPITWDYCETNSILSGTGSFDGGVDWVVRFIEHGLYAASDNPAPSIFQNDAVHIDGSVTEQYDAVVTDPPYYDAIPYSDLADFFYVWIRRSLSDISSDYATVFDAPVCPKWDNEQSEGELVEDAARFNGDRVASRTAYENGMFRAFQKCLEALRPDGRLFVVFANKQPEAWETLVASMIRAGSVVIGSWPVVTEMRGGVRNHNRASLASSVWLVCKKRPATARPGWDNKVLEEMRANIGRRLREFWDAGIRGPDFVWAATGPALEAYSKHPIVKMADEAGKIMTVSDFLAHARRMVVDFVVGRVLSGDGDDAAPAMDRLDEPTAYYLLHRHDFGMDEAPAGACILYATACGLSDDALIRDWDLLVKTGGEDTADDGADEEEAEKSDEPAEDSGSGSKVKLKAWNHRRGRSLGMEAPGGRPVPIIDRIHRLMQLWKGGDVHKVDEYADEHGLRRHELFRRVLQSLIELARAGSDERSLLESLSNHVGAKGAKKKDAQPTFLPPDDEHT